MNENRHLPKGFINKDGDTVTIKEMDDYYLRNAFNYAIRRLNAVTDFVRWMSNRMEHMDDIQKFYFCEKHRWAHHLEVLESLPRWIRALGEEAASRGVKSECPNCGGIGVLRNEQGKAIPCLVCCSTGWVMSGIKVMEEQ